MKSISFELSTSSIDRAIKELKKYQESLNERIEEFVRVLANDGVVVARAQLGTLEGDSSDASLGVQVNADGDIVKAVIFLQGKDVLFVEFGSGIYYNNGNAHPMAAELGYGVGTYPSEHPPNRAINPGYWWYKDQGGNLRLSLGTKGVRPIYEAAQNIRNTAIMKAISVFKG